MKKLTIFISILTLSLVAILSPIHAANASAPEISVSPNPTVTPAGQTQTGFLGQNQDYTVTFRGNGEAVINVKVGLTNEGNSPLSKITLTIPGGSNIYNVFAYQVIKQPTCQEYDQPQIYTKDLVPSTLSCIIYAQPDYSDLNVYDNTTTYQVASTSINSSEITITLPTPIQSQQSGSYFLYYRSFAYTTTDLGGSYNYKFTTLKVNDKINTLQVGISTDSDLYLKDSSNNVNYNYNLQAVAASSKTIGPSISSTAYNNFYNDIGSGSIVKNVSDLNNNESYSVSGSYADSAIKVYIKAIIIAVIIVLLLIDIFIYAVRRILKRSKKGPESLDPSVSANSTEVKVPLLSSHKYMLLAIISFTVSLIITIYTVGIYAVSQLNLNSNTGTQTLFEIFYLLLSFGVYIFLLFAPSIIIGIKFGWIWTIKYFAMLLIWFALFFSITLLIFAVFQNTPNITNNYIIPQSSQATN